MTRAEEAALKAYPPIQMNCDGEIVHPGYDKHTRVIYQEGYEQAEKDMKERFIQFIHRHYPINYIGWIQDFQRAMED